MFGDQFSRGCAHQAVDAITRSGVRCEVFYGCDVRPERLVSMQRVAQTSGVPVRACAHAHIGLLGRVTILFCVQSHLYT